MPNTTSFWDHPIQTIQEAVDIRKQIESLQTKLSKMLGTASTAVAPQPKGRRKMSPATIAKMRAAQQARWATKKGKAAVKTVVKKSKMSPAARAKISAAAKARWARVKAPVKAAVKSAPKAKAPKKKGTLTPEGRAKLAAAMKARWAARKAGGAAPNASAS